MRQLPPAVNYVGIDAVGHRHLGHRRAGLAAFGQHLSLLLQAVPPSCLLVACHHVHLSLCGQHPCRRRQTIQDDIAGRIRFSDADGTSAYPAIASRAMVPIARRSIQRLCRGMQDGPIARSQACRASALSASAFACLAQTAQTAWMACYVVRSKHVVNRLIDGVNLRDRDTMRAATEGQHNGGCEPRADGSARGS